MQTQDHREALVLADNQFAASYVEESQPLLDQNMHADSEVFEVSRGASIFVLVVLIEPTAGSVVDALTDKKDGRGTT